MPIYRWFSLAVWWFASDQNQRRTEQVWNIHDMVRCSTVTSWSVCSHSNSWNTLQSHGHAGRLIISFTICMTVQFKHSLFRSSCFTSSLYLHPLCGACYIVDHWALLQGRSTALLENPPGNEKVRSWNSYVKLKQKPVLEMERSGHETLQ